LLVREHPTEIKYASDLAATYGNLAIVLSSDGDQPGARQALEQARDIFEKQARDHPAVAAFAQNLAKTLMNLGNVLHAAGDLAEARKAHERAREIFERLGREHPEVSEYAQTLARTDGNLGNLFATMGDLPAARQAYERARDLFDRLAGEQPTVTDYAEELGSTYAVLGGVLRNSGDPAGAQKSLEHAQVIMERLAREHPESPQFTSNLGCIFNDRALLDLDAQRFTEARDRLRKAIVCQKESLANNGNHSEYRNQLQSHYTSLIQVAQAIDDQSLAAEAQLGLAELNSNDPQRHALDQRLAAVSKGGTVATNPERLALAQRAYDTHRFALAARLWSEAIEADPKLADGRQPQHRYNAACSAALASAGKGIDDSALDDDAKAKLRARARQWLQAELDTWTKLLEAANDQHRAAIAQILKHWKQDTDLASVRGEVIDTMPESERDLWKALWMKVDALLAKAKAK
jgi:tetratricopeptide (TPR) repeat protein